MRQSTAVDWIQANIVRQLGKGGGLPLEAFSVFFSFFGPKRCLSVIHSLLACWGGVRVWIMIVGMGGEGKGGGEMERHRDKHCTPSGSAIRINALSDATGTYPCCGQYQGDGWT